MRMCLILPLLAAFAMLAAIPASAALWHTYHHAAPPYHISYPHHWILNANDTYNAPSGPMPSVSFSVPASLTTGTNLIMANVNVVTLPAGGPCDPSLFLTPLENVHTVTEGGRTWQVASFDEGAAGTLSTTTVFVLTNSWACFAVIDYVRYHDINFYDPGTVVPFNQAALTATFDLIRLSLHIP